mmetsp:Transcript_26673/g.63600  ORF Transcript_26673/g.63600 Transcript_26673/m.63600 type:complete len:88 (-) Transcript_26673:143-406(-)
MSSLGDKGDDLEDKRADAAATAPPSHNLRRTTWFLNMSVSVLMFCFCYSFSFSFSILLSDAVVYRAAKLDDLNEECFCSCFVSGELN